MSRSLRLCQSRTADMRRLHEIFESALEPGQRRRAQAILLYAAGLAAVEIAHLLEVHANTIYADLHAFDIYGVTAVYRLGQGGAPQQIIGYLCPTLASVKSAARGCASRTTTPCAYRVALSG